MLELYHNAASSCSQKVRLVLAEKGLDYESHVIDLLGGGQHDPAYVKLNPNHVVPTLVHDGNVLIESSLIDEYLEDAFPAVPLRPEGAAARHAMRLWVKLIDEKVHPAAGVLTYAIGPRKLVLAQPAEAREKLIAEIPDPERRAQRRSVIEHGVKAPEFVGALRAFVGLLDRIDTQVPIGGWLSGTHFGLADAAALPYVLRLDHLGLGRLVEARPAAADWLARVQARASFEPAVGSWLPQPMIDLFRKNGEEVWPDIEPLLQRA
jgi:glutathione S-transferase